MRIAIFLGLLGLAAFLRAEDQPQAMADKAAREWLELVDTGKYGDSWTQAADVFKSSVAKDTWEQQVKAVRERTGKLKSRELKSAQPFNDPPNQPPGKYFIIQYDSVFDAGSIVETVVPRLEGEKWKVTGYFMKPANQ